MKIFFKKTIIIFLLSFFILSNFPIDSLYAKSNKDIPQKEIQKIENIQKDHVLKNTFSGKKLERIKKSIKERDNYKLLIKSNDGIASVGSFFGSDNKKTKIKKLGDDLYMIKLSLNDKRFNNEISKLENGIIPSKIGIYDIIQPEIFETLGSDYLSGETLDKLWSLQKIGAQNFVEELSTKEKVKVGVLDTGIDSTHNDLVGNYNNSLSYDFISNNNGGADDNGHGTEVAGIIGAQVNGKGIFGVNPNTDLVSLKVLNQDGIGTTYDLLEAIEYAKINHIRVLNMSFGGTGNPINNPVCKAISDAKKNGIITIVSAGNMNKEVADTIPAACSDAITVGAIDKENKKTSFSNYGDLVDVYAPGVDIYTTTLNNSYITVEGTSFSAAFVSGLVAKELAYNGALSSDTITTDIHTKYDLMSSIYNPSVLTASGTIFGSGEAMAYTGGAIEQNLSEPGKFQANSTSYPSIGNNGVWNCGRIETATFSNGYSLKHYTLAQDFTKNIGRTELYFNGILKEYQDNVFFSTSGAPWFSGDSCYLMSIFSSVVLKDDGTIDINYNFWTGFGWQHGVAPTKFTINQKSISNINVTSSSFGYSPHFYIKLNLLDRSISTTVNIASQGTFDNKWNWISAFPYGSWMWGASWFSGGACSIASIRDVGNEYDIDYNCGVTYSRNGSAVEGPAYSSTEDINGTFNLLKTEYNLCRYDAKFCSEDDYIKYWIFNDKNLGNMGKLQSGSLVSFSDGNGVKNNFSSLLGNYPSEYKNWYESLGITSNVINGSDSRFLIDWNSGEYVNKSSFQNGTRFSTTEGWMITTRNITDVSSDLSGIYWQSHLENTYFTPTDFDWTQYGGDGLALYPIKRKSDNSTQAYIQYPSGNLFCKDVYCVVDSGKFLESTSGGQITPDGKYYIYQNSNDNYKTYKKLVIEEGYGPGEKFLDVSGGGQMTPDSKYYIYQNSNDNYKIYIKGINETGEGVKFLDFNTWGQITPDGKYYIYNNPNDNYKPYKRRISEEGYGVGLKFLDFNTWGQYTPDGRYYIYNNQNDNYKLYKKSISDDSSGDGVKFLYTDSWGQITPDGKLYIYQNGGDNYKIYIKGMDEEGEGVKFLDMNTWGQISPDSKYYVYQNFNDNNKLYKRSIIEDGLGEGVEFSNSNSWGEFTKNSKYFIYQNGGDNYKIYIKGMDEVGAGKKFLDFNTWGQISSDSQYYIYQNPKDNYKIYRKTIEKITTFSFLSSTPANSSTGVVTNTLISLNFSKPLDKTTVPGNIVLRKMGGAIVDTWAVDYSGAVITFHATSPLDKNILYTVELKTGLKDTAGNALVSDSFFSFTTGSEPAQPSQDGTIASTALSPICSRVGYSLAHPECNILNTLVFSANTQTVLNGSEGGSPAGDPVSLPTGEFTYSNTLIHTNGDGLDYDFSLSYKSQVYSNGPVGISWDHSYNISLRENIDDSVTYFDGKSGIYTYAKDTEGNFSRLPGIDADLVKADNGYKLRFINGTTYVFGTNLKITSIRDKDGHILTFAYDDTDNKLLSTTDTLGHTVTYEYYDHSRLKSITDFSGRTVTLAYYNETDEGGSAYDLKSITINNGDVPKTISFTYQKDTTSEILSHNILTLTDSKDNEYVKNIYDENDRVISQKFGDGTLYYSYETTGGDGDDKNHITKTTAINKRGMKSEFNFDTSGNTLTKKLFEGDTAVTTNYTYALNGKISTETKPLGNGTSYLYDAQNRITEKRLKADMTQSDDTANDLVMKFEYATNFSVPTKITDPNNNIIITTLDTKGNIIETRILGVKKADGSTYDMTNTFAYDSTGHLTTKTDGVGNSTKYEYENGRLTKTTEGNEDETTITLFSYDTHGNLLTTTDGEGNIKEFTYDQYDRLVSSLSSEGILQETNYDANNNKTEQKVNLENGKVLKSTSVYDILDQVTGNAVGSDESDERTTHIVRDANGNITETTDAKGLKIEYTYDIFDRIIQKRIITDTNDTSKDIVTKYTYDQNGNIIESTDARNIKTTYQYDHFDRMMMSTDALGTKNILTYDKSGNITIIETKDINNKTLSKTERAFDSLGHVIRETQGAIDGLVGITTTVEYSANGKPVKVTDAKGNNTTVMYDSFGRKKTVTDALGNGTILTYDKRGLTTKQEVRGSDGKSIVILLGYDKDGRLISKTDGLGNKTSSIYNKLGQIVQVTDALGNKTDYSYDVFGNVLSETKYENAKTIKTSYEYDKSNNRTRLIDANGNITTYTYDSVNRFIRETLSDGSFIVYEYDGAGNITKKTDANGTVVNNVYDSLGRLVKRTIVRGTNVLGVTEENYEYDSLGRLVKSTDSDGNILAFDYDTLGRLISETQNGKVVQTGYDPNGNITSLIYPSGKKVVRDYDILNRLTKISHSELVSALKDGLPLKSSIPLATYSYNSLTLDSLTLANGAKTSYGYDTILRLKELTNTTAPSLRDSKNRGNPDQNNIINQYAFSYDATSNILSNGHDSYTYDPLNRLTQANYEATQDKKGIAESFNYDPMGNRFSSLVTQTKENEKEKSKKDDKTKTSTTNYTGNELNQYTSVDRTKLIYDKNGNLTNNGAFQFFYDYRNRLIEVRKISVPSLRGKNDNAGRGNPEKFIAKYFYDVLGRRISKTTYNNENTSRHSELDSESTVIKYVYSNQDAIEENEYRYDDGKEKLKNVKEYIYGKGIDDVIVIISSEVEKSKLKNTKMYFYQKDQIGSITAITDKDGKIVEEYRYDSFGKAYMRDGKSDNWREFKESKIGNTRLFTGREYDREIGLYYYRARYYSAELGRFISRDPIGTRDDVNLYSYVGNNPVGFVDPMGREKSLMVINMAYDLFVRKQTEYSLMNKFGDLIDTLSDTASAAYNTEITAYFMADTVLGESNIKMREDFGMYTTNRIDDPDIVEQFGHAIGGEIYYQGNKIYLADIGNMIFGFNANNIGYSRGFMTAGQYTETFMKFGGDTQSTIKNEEDDNVLINAGYNLGSLSSGKTLSRNDFTRTLLTAAIEAERIRLNQR